VAGERRPHATQDYERELVYRAIESFIEEHI
jgi:hypothetical protein